LSLTINRASGAKDDRDGTEVESHQQHTRKKAAERHGEKLKQELSSGHVSKECTTLPDDEACEEPGGEEMRRKGKNVGITNRVSDNDGDGDEGDGQDEESSSSGNESDEEGGSDEGGSSDEDNSSDDGGSSGQDDSSDDEDM
jgi:hypothetical protein